MCGIVGMLGKVRSSEHDRFLKEAAFADTLRGSHATGAMHVYYNTKAKDKLWADIHKEAVPGPDFIDSPSGGKILTTHPNSVAVVIHNRYSTGGGQQDKHAHPFKRGNVHLVHNGVFDNWREMCSDVGIQPYKEDISVDSDGVAALLEEVNDAKAVLEAAEGAFALVWFDYRTNALHFARNQERPMYFAKAGAVSAFGSEAGLLQWVAGRNRIKVDAVVELPVGQILSVVYDEDKDQMVVGNTTQFKAKPRQPKVWTYYNYVDDDSTSHAYAGNRGTNTSTPTYSSSARTTKDGKSYTDLMSDIEVRVESLGVSMSSSTEWNVDRVVTDHEKDVMHCTSIESPRVRGRKVRYHHAHRNPALWQRLEDEMFSVLSSPDIDVLGAKAPAGRPVLVGKAGGEGWLGMTSDEVFESGSFSVHIDPAKTVLLGVSQDGTIVECFNGPVRWAELNSAQPTEGKMYYVRGLDAAVLRSTYGGSNLVRYTREATDPAMVVVTPVNKPTVSLMVPKADITEVVK